MRSPRHMTLPIVPVLAAVVASAWFCHPAWAQRVEVEEFVLDNGMKFLLVPRTDQPNNIAAGWVAKVGSVNERPGITGISHFFEHMMFKGTDAIGTRDPKQDAEFMARQKAVKDQIDALIWGEQYQRHRAGEINDPWDPANDTDQLRALRNELKRLMDEHGKAIVKNEFDSIYTKQGASGMNAFTTHDLTFYFINVPSNKLELWTWMESDRLGDSVFREFYSERDVVHEERRMRVDSQPTGLIDEQFNAMFWQSSPYSWPVIGWPCDMFSYTREQAEDYFNIYYRPNNVAGVLVGDFDLAQAKSLLRTYFGRLERGAQEPPPVVTLEMKQVGEQRMEAECECQPQVEIRYHSVPVNHVDSFALEMMGELLSGRTGRLYKSMVEGKQIAADAQASQAGFPAPVKYAGVFVFQAEVKGDATPQQLEQAWYEELARLQNEPVSDHELQKVRNQVAADAYRALQNNAPLMMRLGIAEGLGDWRYVNDSPRKLAAVTPADIQRVAKSYFDKTNRSVALLTRKMGAGSTGEAPELAALDPRIRARVKADLARLKSETNLEKLQAQITQIEAFLPQMEANRDKAPPGALEATKFMLENLRQRVADLQAQGGDKITTPAPPALKPEPQK